MCEQHRWQLATPDTTKHDRTAVKEAIDAWHRTVADDPETAPVVPTYFLCSRCRAWKPLAEEERPLFENVKLRTTFERYLAGGLKRATRAEYESALSHWEWTTGNPDVREVNEATVQRFRSTLQSANGIAPATLAKVLRTVAAVFRRIGPRGPANRQGLGFLKAVPDFDRIPVPAPRKRRRVTRAETTALYEACHVTTLPVKWRAAIVCSTETGARSFDLWSEARGVGWQWKNVRKVDRRRRLATGRMLRYRRTEITFYDHRRKEEVCATLSSNALRHLRDLRRIEPRSDRIFPTATRRGMYREWDLIVAEAAKTVHSVSDINPNDLKDAPPPRRPCRESER